MEVTEIVVGAGLEPLVVHLDGGLSGGGLAEDPELLTLLLTGEGGIRPRPVRSVIGLDVVGDSLSSHLLASHGFASAELVHAGFLD